MLALVSLIGAQFPTIVNSSNTVTSGDVLTEFGTYLSSIIGWAGTVIDTVWSTPVLRVLVFMAIPLIGIGIVRRLMNID